jgi:hypothetical protein
LLNLFAMMVEGFLGMEKRKVEELVGTRWFGCDAPSIGAEYRFEVGDAGGKAEIE